MLREHATKVTKALVETFNFLTQYSNTSIITLISKKKTTVRITTSVITSMFTIPIKTDRKISKEVGLIVPVVWAQVVLTPLRHK